MKQIEVAEPIVGSEELEALKEVLYSGNYTSGVKVEEFEEKFAKYCGVKYGVATNSGTAALHTALAAYGIGPGDEVIVPAMTFFSTATSVIHQNAIPIFADIDRGSYNIDPKDIENQITEKTKAIIPVHFLGNPAEMDQINEIAEEHGLIVVEDCAQAHGAEYKGKKVGSFGNCGCFSFFATKNMTTGEGGIIVTDDEEVFKKARIIRNHGMSDRNTHDLLGYNYRMTEFEAAMGLVQLDKLDNFNKKRKENAEYIYKQIKAIEWLKLPEIKKYAKHVFFWCPIEIDEKKLGMNTLELREKLYKNGVGTRHRYLEPLNFQKLLVKKNAYPKKCPFSCPFYDKRIDYAKFSYPNASKIAGKMLGLPNHPNLKKEDLDYVANIIKSIK